MLLIFLKYGIKTSQMMGWIGRRGGTTPSFFMLQVLPASKLFLEDFQDVLDRCRYSII